MSDEILNQARVQELFDYRDGALYWRIRPSNNAKMSEPAGTLRTDGYRAIQVAGRLHFAHRLVWLWHHGEAPEFLDHIDGNQRNNHIENLRPATSSQNGANSRKPSTNTSGFKGVTWNKAAGRFKAQITVNGRKTHLGYFTDPETAHAAYIDAAKQFHGEFARTI